MRAPPVANRRYRSGVGYNPFRKRVARRTDAVVVAAAFVVIVALLIWAVLPR
jgi:hypothetical protein